MQNWVCRHISSTLVNESDLSIQFLSCLQVSSSKNAIFTLGIKSYGEESCSLFLFAAQQLASTFDSGLLWDFSKSSFVKTTHIVDCQLANSISSFLYLEESDSVILSLCSGEIYQIPCLFNYRSSNNQRDVLLEGFGQVETIGIFPQGVHRMQLSPDGEILCLLTGKSQVQIVFMATEDWDILSQQDIGSLENWDKLLQFGSIPSAWNIAWRLDGALVAITYPCGSGNKIQMQVFRRERFTLESSCEEVWDSNSCCIDWQPRIGGAIAASLSNESVIRFYETNGLSLRRLYLDTEIFCKQLQWSEQYHILVCGDETKMRIFYHNNYHWYLKQEWIFSEFGEIAAFRIAQDRVATDRNTLYVLTTNGKIFCFIFQWQFDIYKRPDEDDCYLAVIDGNEIAITMLSQQIIPAPLCSLVLVCSCSIQRVEIDSKGGCLALLSNGAMEYFPYAAIMETAFESNQVTCTKGRQLENSLDKIYKSNEQDKSSKTCRNSFLLPLCIDQKQGLVWKAFALLPVVNSHEDISLQVLMIGERLEMYLCSCQQGKWDYQLLFKKNFRKAEEIEGIGLDIQPVISKEVIDSQRYVICLLESTISLRDIMEYDKKSYWNISLQALGLKGHQILHLKSIDITKRDKESNKNEKKYMAVLFLDDNGRLWMAIQLGSMAESFYSGFSFLLISEECVDFEVISDFVFFTCRFHKLYSYPMNIILDFLEKNTCTTGIYRKLEWNGKQVDCRPIDRFSRIVTFVTDKTAKRNNCLILQAPRGNLECVVPRLVIERIVERHIEQGAYGEAYRLCRRHRLPMDILVEKNPEGFKENILDFIKQFKDPEHLNTFVSMLGSEQEDTIRNEWCNMLIEAFWQSSPESKYRYPLICTFLQKKPPDVFGALQVLQLDRTTSNSKDVVWIEDLMDFLLLLTKDSVLVFREALRLYDSPLAALVVERASDLDPAYYGALLQRLNDTCSEKQKYLIDLELGNMESALRHLFAFSTFPTDCDTVVEFAIQHRLFSVACSLFAEYPEMLVRVRQAYAQDLSQQGQHLEAACFYALIEQDESAREEYKRACIWQLVVYFCHKILWKRLPSSQEYVKHTTYLTKDRLDSDQDFITEMESLVEHLKLNGKGKEAAFIIMNYLNDPQSALEELIRIEEWLDAISILGRVPLQDFWSVVETTWQPALTNAVQEHCEEWKEVANKMRYNCERLEQVRRRKESMGTIENESMNAYLEEEALSESDASSQSVSSLGEWTMSSDTSKASLYSLLSKKGQRRKAKKKNKSKKIKPGDPREEEYLIDSLSKLIPSSTQWDILNQLLQCLIAMCMEKEARKLYEVTKQFACVVQGLPEDIAGRNHFEELFQKWKCLE
ncbi:elongator complex protein 1 isoform 1 [Galdieria sulphuraria]|uniref:Elongator complex protein 1 n=1 Tax=Galdieria sulphuraria TaxID=130081 RepID=M2Y0R0_GALSU|nr:elongator complex protein 1 isoform 1 [Galdieria sulphuraria]EME29399.1 elongator complex protein 1 isoform 1 [Galdieria sulphuraria]|eukprot:XP_005705919.1 elongator complex protein 1 isoform 1 [Galdieria sulphuraria]